MTPVNNDDFKRFLLTGILGIINPSVDADDVIANYGEPLEVRLKNISIGILKVLDYGDLEIAFINDKLFLLNIEMPRRRDSDWYIPKHPDFAWLTDLPGKTFEEVKTYVVQNNIAACRIKIPLMEVDDSSTSIEIESSGVGIGFDGDGVIDSLDYAPDKVGNYERQPL